MHENRFLIIDDFDAWELYVVLKVNFKNKNNKIAKTYIKDYCSRCPKLVDIRS